MCSFRVLIQVCVLREIQKCIAPRGPKISTSGPGLLGNLIIYTTMQVRSAELDSPIWHVLVHYPFDIFSINCESFLYFQVNVNRFLLLD